MLILGMCLIVFCFLIQCRNVISAIRHPERHWTLEENFYTVISNLCLVAGCVTGGMAVLSACAVVLFFVSLLDLRTGIINFFEEFFDDQHE